MKKGGFTMIELIFVIVILGILAAVAIPRYFTMGKSVHETNLISFVATLNRTTGEDLWARSISSGKEGKIKDLSDVEDARFLSKYIKIPQEVNASSINLKNCGDDDFKTIMTGNVDILGEEYNITCKEGDVSHAPYFKLIRIRDNKVLVSRN
jgi:prepilin-type N-terminal cleavage/methylation domain-containing protein